MSSVTSSVSTRSSDRSAVASPQAGRSWIESARAAFWIAAVTVPFYWRVLGHQFSLLVGYEGANQADAWFTFWINTVRRGAWPLWDPYTWSGHPFAGEMQTGAFYPFYLLLTLLPVDRGVLSAFCFHAFYVLTHIVAALFLYWLARELGLSFFAAVVAGICFSLGGVVARVGGWPHLLESSIWLPLILLCLIRAMNRRTFRGAAGYSAMAGLCLALSVLAGGLHLVIMQALAGVGAVAYSAARSVRSAPANQRWALGRRAAAVAGVFALFALAGGAIQLLPSAEYSPRALRFLGATVLRANVRIPYSDLHDNLLPQGFLGLLINVLPASPGNGEYLSPYLGVFPLLLAVIGIWKQWSSFWVPYLAGLSVVAFLYSLGPFSLLNGFVYAVIPLVWMAREVGRFMYLADFGLALLAGFGVDALFQSTKAVSWEPIHRILRWAVIACVAALGYYALLGRGDFPAWTAFSILMVILTFGLFRFIAAGHRGVWARSLMVGLIVFDLYAFDWSAPNVLESRAQNADHFERLVGSRGLADFFRSRPGAFRVHFNADLAPNIGDGYGVQTTTGSGVTVMMNYNRLRGRLDLLNVRYFVKPASAQDPNPVYQDSLWKVYENPRAYPRAWLVHQVTIEKDSDQFWKAIDSSAADLHRIALRQAPLGENLDAGLPGAAETAEISAYDGNRIEVTVHAQSHALLVLSEVYYPGWRASIAGRDVPVRQVDGALRGIVVPAGESRVVLSYAPASFRVGAALSLTAFPLGLALVFFGRREEEPRT